MIVAAGLLLTALALGGFALFLRDQGVERAGQWVSVVGFFISTALGVPGLAVAWLAWRRPSGTSIAGAPAAGLRTARSGSISQNNTGGVNVASTGVIGDVRLPNEMK
ncbi:hypothetical protein ACFHW1_26440 [Micromonospora sp. LOL_014]|uniref:hypothetical protein n=1 Tax=Micromonospora sp. LOL_014 TaxID=3345415 RepID=UPI003A838798